MAESVPHAAHNGAQAGRRARIKNGLPMGALLPPLVLRGRSNPRYNVNTAAGRWVVLIFLPQGTDSTLIHRKLSSVRAKFDDSFAATFVIQICSAISETQVGADQLPGIRFLSDIDGVGATQCGFQPSEGGIMLLDPALRVMTCATLEKADVLLAVLKHVSAPAEHAGTELHAPVLILPRVLEPALCQRLIHFYEKSGGTPSGFMRDVGGQTRLLQDPNHKIRSDVTINDADLLKVLHSRVSDSIVGAIKQSFHFDATRIERFIVACYDGNSGGYFRPHRDNTTAVTAHRRFAVTINLNTPEFSGGELRFPEFGNRLYKAPLGGAIVFSCSLLHEAMPVTQGKRYAFLPFLYDEAAASSRVRVEKQKEH